MPFQNSDSFRDVSVHDEARAIWAAGVEEVNNTLSCHGRSPARLDWPASRPPILFGIAQKNAGIRPGPHGPEIL